MKPTSNPNFGINSDDTLVYLGTEKPRTTAEAFDLSIQKYQVLVELLNSGQDIWDGASETCGLCMKFFDEDEAESDGDGCGKCPIYLETGRPECRGTPWANGDYVAELAFLIDLKAKYVDVP